MRRRWKVFAVAVWTVAACDGALAAACERIAAMGALDVVRDASGRPLIPVTLEGRRTRLLVDSGGFASMLQESTVRELGLPRIEAAPSPFTVNGARANGIVRIRAFGLGPLSLGDQPFWVDPGGANRPIGERDVAGQIGGDFLYDYNVDFDFAARRLTLFPQSHCPAAGSLAAVPFRITDQFHVLVPVVLDGKRFEALLDTGSADTHLDLAAARRAFPLNFDGRTRPGFASLAIGTVTIERPAIMLVADVAGRAGDPAELILGMSVLSRLRLYIPYVERELYLEPAATGPQFAQ
jgi:predicted aspartyl protease